MNNQPEALRLAEQLESDYDPLLHLIKPAAAELRRLHKVNQALLEELVRYADELFNLRKELAKPEQEPIKAIDDVIDYLYGTGADNDMANKAHRALKQLQINLRDQTALHLLYKGDYEDLLAKPEQEELIQFKDGKWSYVKKPWVGLTGIEVRRLKDIHIPLYSTPTLDDYLNFYRAIENELIDKNTT